VKTSVFLLVLMIALTAIIAAYRRYVARNEDDFLHLEDPTGTLINQQVKTARSLTKIDHLGIGLTIATSVYAAGLLVVFIYTELNRVF
jgi:hypothetical protein